MMESDIFILNGLDRWQRLSSKDKKCTNDSTDRTLPYLYSYNIRRYSVKHTDVSNLQYLTFEQRSSLAD